MSCNRLRALFAIPILALLAACQREPARPAVERVAILRFENLGAAPADDWMGRAFSEVIAGELEGAPGISSILPGKLRAVDLEFGRRPPMAPGVSAERAAALAAGATRIGYGQYLVRNGVVYARMTMEDGITGKMTVLNPTSAQAADILPAASALASQISPHSKNYATQNVQVLRAHVDAFESADQEGVMEALQNAIAADPNFGPCYRQLAQMKLQRKDVAGALAVLQQALARGNAIGDTERARIQLEDAGLRNDTAARLQALGALAKVDPGDPQTWHDLAIFSMASHRYAEAIDAYRKLLAIQPADADSWNQLGYAAANVGDASTAASAMANYQKLQPASPNPLDSQGDVQLIMGHPAEAENFYLQGAKKDPKFFAGLDYLKAALVHLMTGDIQGADALAQQYLDSRAAAKDPLLDYRKAQWSWFSGRRKSACQQMEKLAHDSEAGGVREVASRAYAELAMWNLMLGNRDAAAQAAQKAVALITPSSATTAVLARFLSQPPASPAEWEQRANQLAPNPSQAPIRTLALTDALLVAKEFGPAAALLQPMYDRGNAAADEGLPVALAWADLESGHVQEAAALLKSNIALADTGMSWSTALYFPRIFYLRGLAAQKQSKSAEARQNFDLFLKLSGPDPLMWGEEQKAK